MTAHAAKGGAITYVQAPSGDSTGVTDRTMIQALVDAGATALDFSAGKGGTYTLDRSITLTTPGMSLYVYGVKSPFRQTSWGVPAFEVRSTDVSIFGELVCTFTGPRTLFDSAALTASNNSATVKTECVGDPKAAGGAVYCHDSYSRLYIERLSVSGFINGIVMFDETSRDWHIGSLRVDTVDFGFFGRPGIHGSIGVLQALNITHTQGVDEHAIYCVTGNTSYGFNVGACLVDTIATNTSHGISIKSIDGFHMGYLDVQNAGSIANFVTVRGDIDFISSRSMVALANTDATACILAQVSSIVQIAGCDIVANVGGNSSLSSDYSRVFDCTGSSELTVQKPRVQMIHATPGAVFRTSALAWWNDAEIIYVNALPSGLAAFMLAGGSKSATVCAYIKKPYLRGTDQLIRPESAADAYDAEIDPNLINNGVPSDTSIVSGTANYHTRLIAELETPIALTNNSTTPRLRAPANNWLASNSSPTSITAFTSGTNGCRFSVRATNANTTLVQGASLRLSAGVNLTLAAGQVIFFQYLNGISYEVGNTA